LEGPAVMPGFLIAIACRNKKGVQPNVLDEPLFIESGINDKLLVKSDK
jgi:hypothetical protein